MNWISLKLLRKMLLLNKILDSLPSEFFYFNFVWDNTSEAEKALLNLFERLIKEEEKLKYAAQNLVDVTKAFCSPFFSHKQSLSSSTSSHFCTSQKCPHSSHSQLTRPLIPKFLLVVNANSTPLTLEQRQIRQKHFDDLQKNYSLPYHACSHTGH
jgi:hypothetical protein